MKPTSDSKATRVGTAALRLLSDERLAALAAGGDRAAFAVIFDRYQQRLYSYCASILRDRDDAADAVQNTMLRAMHALEGEQREISVRPWLYRIAHNEAIDILRRPRTEPHTGAEVVTVSDVEADAAVRAHLRAVLDDIRELPERQRSALVMRELSGLSYGEIGAALMTSEGGAKQAVYDARRALHDLAKGRETDCDAIRRKLSDGDRRVFRGRAVRAHLMACTDCRTWQAELAARQTSWAAFAPTMPLAAITAVKAATTGGAGAGAAGAASVAAAVSGPAIATVAVAVVLGAGAVGVHELKKDDSARPPAGLALSQGTPASAPARHLVAVKTTSDRRAHPKASRADRRAASKARAERARARAEAPAANDRAATDPLRDTQAGAGSTGLGGSTAATGGSSTSTRGSRSGGITLGGGRRGGGGRNGGQGPVSTGVGQATTTVVGTVNQVQEALPVQTPPVSIPRVRPRGDGGAAPKRTAR
jgi:RNA polymerase sigma factor (sigma-70 family)